jgi:hypothetical protein
MRLRQTTWNSTEERQAEEVESKCDSRCPVSEKMPNVMTWETKKWIGIVFFE